MSTKESTSCTKCPIGQYGPQKGLARCADCPPGRTTGFSGAVDEEACQCQGELYQGQCTLAPRTVEFLFRMTCSCHVGMFPLTLAVLKFIPIMLRTVSIRGNIPHAMCAGGLGVVCSFVDRYEAGQCLQCAEGLDCDGSSAATVQPGYYTDPSALAGIKTRKGPVVFQLHVEVRNLEHPLFVLMHPKRKS